jgi:hypothetical protein
MKNILKNNYYHNLLYKYIFYGFGMCTKSKFYLLHLLSSES